MSRSRIITDLVTENMNIESALYRLKVIFYELKSKNLNDWIDSEINGYALDQDIPAYRKVRGVLLGTFTNGRIIVRDNPLPAVHLNEKDSALCTVGEFKESVSGLYGMGENHVKSYLPLEIIQEIIGNRHGLAIYDAYIEFGKNHINGIISNIKNTTLDILLKTEEEFGNLDSLDIFNQATINDKKKTEFSQLIFNMVYDQSSKISLGNNNTLKGSDITI
ncbi:hypothetical protein [Paenibacillus sp. 8b26]|uniref:AbiTii domain-containing protein n=1 Tax=Paenibacillus sp. 8b26 TaxID=3424133 RepID=UPI003D661B7F